MRVPSLLGSVSVFPCGDVSVSWADTPILSVAGVVGVC